MMRLLAWLRGPSDRPTTWCDECQVPFGEGFCDLCRINRGEDPYEREDEL